MRYFFTTFSIFCLCFFNLKKAIAQEQSLYLEFGGSGGLGSFNYERIFMSRPSVDISWRAGLSLAPIDRNNGTGLVFPLMLHSTWGHKTNKFDFGIGQGITVTTHASFYTLTTFSAGIRHQKEGSLWFWRMSYTPLLSYIADRQWQHWAGFSIGYQWRREY